MDDNPTAPGPVGSRTGRGNTADAPLLSIGLPVYNGAKHLRESIESLLAQDIDDLELIVCDNASTDETPAIVQEYAARDQRVTYRRNESNIGAAANFNLAFELARGTYFMWGSDDDIWDPRFASACIARLEASPGAVLCTSQVAVIDDAGQPHARSYRSIDTIGMSTEERVRAFLERPAWFEVYSVFRPDALRRTGGYATSFGGDVHMLLELILLGDFTAAPETLLKYRLPDRLKTAGDMTEEIGADPEQAAQALRPGHFLVQDLASVIRGSRYDAATTGRILAEYADDLAEEDNPWGAQVLTELGTDQLPGWARRRVLGEVLGLQPELEDARKAFAKPSPWELADGMRLSGTRGTLLRVLKPFLDRQSASDKGRDVALALLADEVQRLRERVEQLESRLDPDRDQ